MKRDINLLLEARAKKQNDSPIFTFILFGILAIVLLGVGIYVPNMSLNRQQKELDDLTKQAEDMSNIPVELAIAREEFEELNSVIKMIEGIDSTSPEIQVILAEINKYCPQELMLIECTTENGIGIISGVTNADKYISQLVIGLEQSEIIKSTQIVSVFPLEPDNVAIFNLLNVLYPDKYIYTREFIVSFTVDPPVRPIDIIKAEQEAEQ